MKLSEIVVTVEPTRGHSRFPVDMLRYDGLHPNSETDSYKIDRTYEFGVRQAPEAVQLRKWDERRWTPNAARWESFGWKVTNVEVTGREMR